MSAQRSKRTVIIALGLAVGLALLAWLVGQSIKSPAQIAAETSAPDASAITVPVEKRVLSSEVIVRGTVRYGSPQPVVLATSNVKAAAGAGRADIVTTRPRRGSKFARARPSCRCRAVRSSSCEARWRLTATWGRKQRPRRPAARAVARALGLFPGRGRRPL